MSHFSDLSDITHLPPPKHTGYLRSRGHGRTLSVMPSEFMRKNFINRMLLFIY